LRYFLTLLVEATPAPKDRGSRGPGTSTTEIRIGKRKTRRKSPFKGGIDA
jgi:hypothetical protein